jgi:excisionase family DNA binding protein
MPERVTIREAARRLGVSPDTIRRRIRGGELASTRAQQGKGSIIYVELPDAAPNAKPTAGEEYSSPADLGSSVASSRGEEYSSPLPPEVEILKDYVSELKRQLEAREREVRELHVLLEQAQRALPPPRAEPNAEPMAQPYAEPVPGPMPERDEPSAPWYRRLWQSIGLQSQP